MNLTEDFRDQVLLATYDLLLAPLLSALLQLRQH